VNRSEFCSIVGRDDFERAVRAAATPAFLYFARVVRKRHADLVGCLPASFHVYYAVKANPNPFLLRELSSMGVGADVASTGELNAAVANGISPDRIEFSGPGKSAREIADAIRLGVSSINAESLPELESIARASSQGGIRARAGVRINPGVSPTEAGLQMAGATQFGIPICQLEEALQFIRANPDTIEFTGLHVHAGSQLLSSAAVAQNFRSILDLAMRIVDLGILPLRKINFGGGWGVTYFPHQTPVDLADLSVGLADVFTQKAYAELRDVRHIVEPGRFLVGECGLYVTSVVYRKPGARREFLIVDGGMHQHYLLAGGMGQVIRRNFEMDVVPADAGPRSSERAYDVAGCLCTPQDVLASDFHSDREVHVGDRIVFFNSGAYGVTASPVHFLGHQPPSEMIV
jgi:diaminopimelate decarboxylase